MVKTLDRAQLLSFVSDESEPSVSLVLRTQDKGAARLEAPIRLKNMVASAEVELHEAGVSADSILELLEPVREFQDSHDWLHQSGGLAIYRSRGTFKVFEIDAPATDRTIVDRGFFIRPLLGLTAGGGCYVLMLDQHHTRLLHVDQTGIEDVEVDDLPHSKREAVHGHAHRESRAHSAGHGVMHHGSSDHDDSKEELHQYCAAVNRAIAPVLATTDEPLVLAGVEYLTAMFRDTTSYRHVSHETLPGSHKADSGESIRVAAMGILKAESDRTHERARGVFAELNGTGLASSRLEEAMGAAYAGRLKTLFIDESAIAWGRYDEKNNHLHHSAAKGQGDQELLNALAVQTLKQGGVVYDVAPDKVPGNTAVAAIFRY